MLLCALQAVAAALLFAAVGWSAHLVAWRLVPGASASTRWSAAALLAGWSLVALFWVLSPFAGFRTVVVLPLWLVAAALATRLWDRDGEGRAALRADLGRAAILARGLDRPRRVLAFAVGAVAGLRVLRGLAEPPLGWDALTYHLVKAGSWVQAGGWTPFRAPDAWGYYGYFAEAGDVLWAWAMLPVRGDALLTPAGAAVWAAALVGVYAAARDLGASENGAVSAALAVGASPAVLAYLSSAYVDNVTLAAFTLGSVFVVRLARGREVSLGAEASLAFAGLALAVGTKLQAAPLFAVGAAVVLARIVATRASARLRLLALGLCLVAVLPALPSYARAWIDHGSPLYPFALDLGGRMISAGNEEARVVGEAILADPRSYVSPRETLAYLFTRPAGGGSFLGFGLGAPFVLLLVLGAAGRWRGRGLAAAYLVLSVAVLTALFFSGAMTSARVTFMVRTAARYFTPALAAMAILASLARGRISTILWSTAVGGGLLLALPRGWATIEAAPLSAAFAVVAVVAAGVAVAVRLRGRRALAAAVVVATVAIAGAGLETARAAYRYPLYRAAADPSAPVFHMHPLHTFYAAAWPAWEALDGAAPARLAVAAGFDGMGHNWYLYPLLGGELGNRVSYVPPTRDGSLVDYRDRPRLAAAACFPCWLERLVDREIDYLVTLAPRDLPEDVWALGHPEIFTPVFFRPNPVGAVFALDAAAARRELTSNRRDPGEGEPATQVPSGAPPNAVR